MVVLRSNIEELFEMKGKGKEEEVEEGKQILNKRIIRVLNGVSLTGFVC